MRPGPILVALAAGLLSGQLVPQESKAARRPAAAADAADVQAALELLSIEENENEALRIIERAYRARAPEKIRPYLAHPKLVVRLQAAHRLGDLKDRGSTELLARLLAAHEPAALRRQAARSLSLLRSPEARAALRGALLDKDSRVRLHAATIFLGGAASPAEVQSLLEAIDTFADDPDGARAQAVLVLHDEGDPRVLKDLVSTKRGGPAFQQALVYCFQDLAPALSAVDRRRVLGAALHSPNESLRRFAIQSLAADGDPDLRPLLAAALADEQDPALKTLLEQTVAGLARRPHLKPALGALQDKARGLLAWARTGFQRFIVRYRSLRPPVRIAVAGAPLLLLLVLGLWLRLRAAKRRVATQRQIEALLGPSMDEPSPPESSLQAGATDPMPGFTPELGTESALVSLYEEGDGDAGAEAPTAPEGRAGG